MRRASLIALTLVTSAVVAGAFYRTAMTRPIPDGWDLRHYDVVCAFLAATGGVVAGTVTRRPLTFAVGASLGLLAAAAELETHTDVPVDPMFAIQLAIENQGALFLAVLFAGTIGALLGSNRAVSAQTPASRASSLSWLFFELSACSIRTPQPRFTLRLVRSLRLQPGEQSTLRRPHAL